MKKALLWTAVLLAALLMVTGCSVINEWLEEIPLPNEEPALTEEPVMDEPAADEPAADEPAADEPVADEPVKVEPQDSGAVPIEPPADAAEGFAVGNIAPNFTVELLDGSKVTLWEQRGSVVFLNFWATWCGPCVGEMPHMQAIHEKYPELTMIAVDMQEEESTVTGFMKDNGFTFDAGIDNGEIAELYRIEFIPQTYLLNTDGTILFVADGSMDTATMANAVESALGY